jgi:hypothetical protein
MKKIVLTIIIFLNCAFICFGQRTYYGYKSSSSYNQTSEENDRINCDDAIKLVERKGRYLDVSFGGYRTVVIEKIRWYEYDDILYSIVYFKSNIYKGYIYGGWKYNFDDYYSIKKAFEASESKGDFFWKYIEKAKIDCD